jgi:nitrogen fixation protein NifU and related proteins
MDLRELYQEVILDHNKSPRNRRVIDDASQEAEGHNPLCGDRVQVFLKLTDGRIEDVSFDGVGCAISTASASMMTEAVKGKTVGEAREVFETFHEMVTEEGEHAALPEDLESLEALAGVKEFPVRVKCATLAWHTFKAALDDEGKVSTE